MTSCLAYRCWAWAQPPQHGLKARKKSGNENATCKWLLRSTLESLLSHTVLFLELFLVLCTFREHNDNTRLEQEKRCIRMPSFSFSWVIHTEYGIHYVEVMIAWWLSSWSTDASTVDATVTAVAGSGTEARPVCSLGLRSTAKSISVKVGGKELWLESHCLWHFLVFALVALLLHLSILVLRFSDFWSIMVLMLSRFFCFRSICGVPIFQPLSSLLCRHGLLHLKSFLGDFSGTLGVALSGWCIVLCISSSRMD